MSTSHSSELSSPANDDLPPLDDNVDDGSAAEQSPLVHLVPHTWQQFLELDPPGIGYYEYVDGYVIWRPNKSDPEYIRLAHSHSTVLRCSHDVVIVPTASIELVSDQNRHQSTVDLDRGSPEHGHESLSGNRDCAASSRDRDRAASPRDRECESSPGDCNQGSASRDPVRIQSEMRHADLAIMKARTDSANSSTTSRDPLAKKRIYLPLPLTTELLAVVEITCSSTRSTALTSKWTSYARSKVPMYIILDRGTDRAGTERIIVGTQDPQGNDALQSVSGDRQVSPVSRNRRTGRQEPPRYYYRKVYSPNDIVNCPYYSELALDASKLLDPDFMEKLAWRKDSERRGWSRRLQVQEQQLHQTNEELHQSNEELHQSNEELHQSYEELHQTNEELKKGNQKLRKEYEEALAQLDYYERKEMAKRNSSRDSSSHSSSPEHKKARKQE